MSLTIKASRDLEDIIRQALNGYLTAYVRPYPAQPKLPNVLVQQTGGTDDNGDIDTATIVLDARAETAEDALYTLRVAIGALRTIAANQSTPLRNVNLVTSGSWTHDPHDPTIAMCSATLQVTAHKETMTLENLTP